MDPKQAAEVSKYLKSLGYVSKEDQEAELKSLRNELGSLKQGNDRGTDLYFRSQEATARQQLTSWLAADKVTDPEASDKVGSLIKRIIDGDQNLIDRWSQGGEEGLSVVREVYDSLKSSPFAAPAAPAPVTNYAADKQKAIAVNKNLPGQGTSAKKGVAPPTARKGPRVDPMKDMHDKAWAEFQRVKAL